MNYTTAVFLINPDVRAVKCKYEEEERANTTIFKTFDNTIKVDDLVVVPTKTRHKMTVVKVVEVDVDLDVESPVEICWVIDKVDLLPHQHVLEMEQQAISTIKSAQRAKQRRELGAALLADADGVKATELATFCIDKTPPQT